MSKPKPAAADLIDLRPLKPYEHNARTHSPDQIEQIKASFRRFGWVGVVAYDAKGIAIGHGRRTAALEMWEAGETIMGPGKRDPLPKWHAPAVDITGLTDDERRALIIADNKLALNAGWDDEKLAAELRALSLVDFDMPVIGFDAGELAKLFSVGRARDPDETPEPPANPASRPGDIWLLGSHRIICGDATDAAVRDAVAGGDLLALLMTDPPYGIGYEYREHDDTDSEANADLVAKVFALAPAGKVWTPGKMNLARDIARFGDAKMAIWHKGYAAAGNGLGGASTLEPVLILDPPQKALKNDYLHFSTDREELDGRMLRQHHPCPKPVALYAHLIEAFAPVGTVIYEPFSGSGTTIMAGEMVGRPVRAVEITPAYVDVAVKRWEKFTSAAARLQATGQTFAEVVAERLEPEREDA